MPSKSERVPRLVAGVDLTKLPLSPLEGFVVSRMDGAASLSVLADLTNLDEHKIVEIVDRLIGLGAAEWARESVSLPRPTGRPATRTPQTPFTVPDSLRSPPPPRATAPRPMRHRQSGSIARPVDTENVYRSSPQEEHVELSSRASAHPPETPRASHTGTLHPPGELVEDEEFATADTVPPPAEPEPTPWEAETPTPFEAAPMDPEVPVEPARTPSLPPPASAPAAEDLDLDPARRKRIDDLYIALDLLDHYQVLGIARDAPQPEVRNAYFQLSKFFHPDTMFRKKLGTYKGKMEAIFKRLTESYEVLGKKRARQEYDRYLELQDHTRAYEAIQAPRVPVADERVQAERAAKEEAQYARSSSMPPEPTPEVKIEPKPAPEARVMSEEARGRARELMAKKLRNAARASETRRNKKVSVDEREPSIAPPAQPSDKKQVLRSLATSLRDSAGHTGGVDQVQRHVLSARRMESDGDLMGASRELRLAMAMAPTRDDLRSEHARLNAALAATLATSYEEQARYEQRHGKWAAAAISWGKVFEGRPDDARVARYAAEALVEAKGDLRKAKMLAQRAAELGPDDVENLRALGKVYIAAGLPLNARRVLQRAATLDPSNEMVENLLRDLDR